MPRCGGDVYASYGKWCVEAIQTQTQSSTRSRCQPGAIPPMLRQNAKQWTTLTKDLLVAASLGDPNHRIHMIDRQRDIIQTWLA